MIILGYIFSLNKLTCLTSKRMLPDHENLMDVSLRLISMFLTASRTSRLPSLFMSLHFAFLLRCFTASQLNVLNRASWHTCFCSSLFSGYTIFLSEKARYFSFRFFLFSNLFRVFVFIVFSHRCGAGAFCWGGQYK